MRALTLTELDGLRSVPGRAALLYLTDRCPVGCAHCSVDSRLDSPTIVDRAAFRSIVTDLAAIDGLVVVGISGGEPFVERGALIEAVSLLADAGKLVVPYTSGIWARGGVPGWVGGVLSRSSSVVLSTDVFHLPGVDHATVVAAARAVVDAGAWLIVQVADAGDSVERARGALDEACGTRWDEVAELSVVPALHVGRGRDSVAAPTRRRPAVEFGMCEAAAAPVVRYDGRATACCNEEVITGLGPSRLSRDVSAAGGVAGALASFRDDPVLDAVRLVGLGTLAQLPRYAAAASGRYRTICELCWAVNEAAGTAGAAGDDDPATRALVAITSRLPGPHVR